MTEFNRQDSPWRKSMSCLRALCPELLPPNDGNSYPPESWRSWKMSEIQFRYPRTSRPPHGRIHRRTIRPTAPTHDRRGLCHPRRHRRRRRGLCALSRRRRLVRLSRGYHRISSLAHGLRRRHLPNLARLSSDRRYASDGGPRLHLARRQKHPRRRHHQ
jgi:hypothetical protein